MSRLENPETATGQQKGLLKKLDISSLAPPVILGTEVVEIAVRLGLIFSVIGCWL